MCVCYRKFILFKVMPSDRRISVVQLVLSSSQHFCSSEFKSAKTGKMKLILSIGLLAIASVAFADRNLFRLFFIYFGLLDSDVLQFFLKRIFLKYSKLIPNNFMKQNIYFIQTEDFKLLQIYKEQATFCLKISYIHIYC